MTIGYLDSKPSTVGKIRNREPLNSKQIMDPKPKAKPQTLSRNGQFPQPKRQGLFSYLQPSSYC